MARFSLNLIRETQAGVLASYEAEIERQSRFIAIFGSIAALLGMPLYIPIDMRLVPGEMLIPVFRLAVCAIALIVLILGFVPYFRGRSSLLVKVLGYSVLNATAIWTGLAKGEPTYMGGYFFVLMLALLSPLPLAWNYGMLASSLLTFFAVGLSLGMDVTTLHFRFSIMVLLVELLVICFSAYLFDYLRRDNYAKSKALIAEKNALARRNEEIELELNLARLIQERLIPSSCPIPGVASLYRPMNLVGGDFFDYVHFRETNELGIFLSDVSGHGVPAAFITSMIKSFILQAGEVRRDPALLLGRLNGHLFNQTNGNFITAFYGIFNFTTGRLLYSNAGHHPPIVLGPGGMRELDVPRGGLPLAILSGREMEEAGRKFVNAEAVLPPATKLVFYTDGLTETTSVHSPGDDFRSALLERTMEELERSSCRDFIDRMFHRLVEFRGSDRFEDDICLICIDIAGG